MTPNRKKKLFNDLEEGKVEIIFEKRNKAQNLVYWLKSLSYKLEVINQSYLVSKCDEFRNGIEEIYLAHRHVSR